MFEELTQYDMEDAARVRLMDVYFELLGTVNNFQLHLPDLPQAARGITALGPHSAKVNMGPG